MADHNTFKQVAREAATICPAPVSLTFDLLTLEMVSESRVTWASSVPMLVFLGLTVLDLCPMYATDIRQTDVRQKHHRLMPRLRGWGIKISEDTWQSKQI